MLVIACSTPLTCAASPDLSGAYLSIGAGYASTQASGYDDARSKEYAAGYSTNTIGLEIAYVKTDNFDLMGSNGSSIKLTMSRALVYAKYPLSHAIYLAPSLGMASWNARAFLIGQYVGRDKGNSMVWGAKLGLYLSKHLSAGFNLLEYRDVTGTNIRTANLFAGYRF